MPHHSEGYFCAPVKNRVLLVSLFGATAVALGAIGAHGLRPQLTDVAFNSFETGVRYLFFHTLLLAIIALAAHEGRYRWSFRLIALGTVMFSGSIFMLSTRGIHGLEGVKVLGPVTPVGGLLLIAGWLAMAFESKNFTKDQ